jgi:hypothetical protein
MSACSALCGSGLSWRLCRQSPSLPPRRRRDKHQPDRAIPRPSSFAEIPVESTRSQNIAVTCRRSPTASAGGVTGVGAAGFGDPSVAIAFRSLSRAPSGKPSSRRWSSVRLCRTASSISLSRSTASYFSRPRLRSQPPRSMKGVLTARRPLCGAFNPHIDLVAERYKVDRLGQKRLGAILQCLALRLHVAIGGDHDDRDIRS